MPYGCDRPQAMVTHELLGTIKGTNAEVDMLKAALIDMTAQRDARMDMSMLAGQQAGAGLSAPEAEELKVCGDEIRRGNCSWKTSLCATRVVPSLVSAVAALRGRCKSGHPHPGKITPSCHWFSFPKTKVKPSLASKFHRGAIAPSPRSVWCSSSKKVGPRERERESPRRTAVSRTKTYRCAIFLLLDACLGQEEVKLHKKKAAALKVELQETSEALLALLEETRK